MLRIRGDRASLLSALFSDQGKSAIKTSAQNPSNQAPVNFVF